jgi:hypothetical protein
MRKSIFPTIIILSLFACTELYKADIDSDQQVLIIDGFLGNVPGNNYVTLSISLPFDSIGNRKKISGARVLLTDNTGSNILFKETSAGTYKPANSSFAGEINKTYTLTVETPDKQVYLSSPQKMLPQVDPARVSGGYAKNIFLVENSNGQISRREDDICEIYYDFTNSGGEIPRFRFTSSQIIEYAIFKEVMPPRNNISGYLFYCWFVENDNYLIFTNEKYKTSADEIKNQIVCSTTADKGIMVPDMSINTLSYDDVLIKWYESNRIIRINQYRLNPDSYTWYKGIESQSAVEGKMFDPLATQLYGNIFCQTDPEKLVLGFFEVSSVATYSWAVSRNGWGTPIVIRSVPNVYPSPKGFTINITPAFWIN